MARSLNVSEKSRIKQHKQLVASAFYGGLLFCLERNLYPIGLVSKRGVRPNIDFRMTGCNLVKTRCDIEFVLASIDHLSMKRLGSESLSDRLELLAKQFGDARQHVDVFDRKNGPAQINPADQI